MDNKYTVISEFVCNGKNMVVVKFHNSVHIILMDEWKIIYGRMHPERWIKDKKLKSNRIPRKNKKVS